MKKIVISALFFSTVLLGNAGDFISISPEEYAITGKVLPEYTTQISVGNVTDGQEFSVSVVYPEYKRLTSSEKRIIKRAGLSPRTEVDIDQSLSFSREEGLLNIHFYPFLQKNGEWVRLTSCKLEVSPIANTTVNARAFSPLTHPLSTPESARYASQSVLASGKWVKIRVDAEGIYQLTDKQLSSMGFKNPSRVKLYGYGGLILPQKFEFSGANRWKDDLEEIPLFRRSGSLLFYSEGTVKWTYQKNTNRWAHENNPYSSHAYYFLTEGDAPASFTTLERVSNPAQTLSTVTAHALYEKDNFSWYEGGREFVDGYDFINGNKKAFTLSTPDIVSNEGKIEVAFTASNRSSATSVNLKINDASSSGTNLLIRAYGENESARGVIRLFPETNLTENNKFNFTATNGHNARLDYIVATYQRKLSAKNTGYSFTPHGTGNTALQIADANANTRLWRIGDGVRTTAEVAGSISGSTYTAVVEDPALQYVMVDIAANYPSPSVVGTIANQNLHADEPVDMVIIIPTSEKLKAQAQRLADAHNADGITTRIVRADQIYNEFSSGTPDATAYRRYMKMLYDKAESTKKPKYLLFFGDAIWDNRHVTEGTKNLNSDDFLLAYEQNSSIPSTINLGGAYDFSLGTLHSYPTDDYYGLLNDSEGQNITNEAIDLGIGRIPCHTEEKAKILVDKILAYMRNEHTGMWKNTITMLADEGDNNLHMNGSESVARRIIQTTNDQFIIKKFYWDSYTRTSNASGNSYPLVSEQLREQMSRGSLLFNYLGHGNPLQISHSKLLYASDFEKYTSSNTPLWVLASCEITPFDQLIDDIGRIALFNPKGGAIGVMCASRAVYASYNTSLNIAFDEKVLTEGMTLGDAMREAKAQMVARNSDNTINKLKYNLYGDPAVMLRRPTVGIVLDSINGQALTASADLQLSAGSIARFSGHIEKAGAVASTFNGTIAANIFDREQSITCKNNDGSASTPLTYKTRGNAIYQGNDAVRNGKFTLQTVIPRDISYSTDKGRIVFYAVNTEKSEEYHGYSSAFHLNGTSPTADADAVGPKVFIYLNTPSFPNGGKVGTNALFGATISDNAGINASGNSIGHEMELILDDDYANTIKLNDYFTFDFGSYQKGSILYDLTNLPAGRHNLKLRVWDVNDNSTISSLDFYVGDYKEYDIDATENPATTTTNFIVTHANNDPSTTVVVDVFDAAGRLWWSKSVESTTGGYVTIPWNLQGRDGGRLTPGVYVYRAQIKAPSVDTSTEAKKIIVIKQ